MIRLYLLVLLIISASEDAVRAEPKGRREEMNNRRSSLQYEGQCLREIDFGSFGSLSLSLVSDVQCL